MKTSILTTLIMVLMAATISVAAQSTVSIKGDEITYMDGAAHLKGYVAYNEKQEGKRPAILVVPEWWGNNDYTRMRARMLAEMGYIAIAVDMYGDGKLATNPTEAQAYAMYFYKDPALGKSRLEAAMQKIKEYPQTDPARIAAIGYCFGGSMVLNAAKMGMPLVGVVSFHGGLATVPATPGSTKAKILVCHGAADKFVSEDDIRKFKSNLDSVKAPYSFKVYEGATHAFSNPDATATGKKFNMPIAYSESADMQSWQDMKIFLNHLLSDMAEDLTIVTGSKKEIYQSLLPQISALTDGEPDLVANLANIAAALKEQFRWFWVGFYLVKKDELVLGPFQGPVACTRIRLGRGVCGAAWQRAETLVVPDVDQFPGHIACSSLSRSEIVVPILREGQVVGVLDVDSELRDHFDETDKRYLEEIVANIQIGPYEAALT